MIVIFFVEVRVTKISATTFVNGFCKLFPWHILHFSIIISRKTTINPRTILSFKTEICSSTTKNMTFQQSNNYHKLQPINIQYITTTYL